MPGPVWRGSQDSARWLPSWLPRDRGVSRGSRGSSPATCVRIGARSRVSLRRTNRLARILCAACVSRWASRRLARRGGPTWQLILYGAGSPAHQGRPGMATKVMIALEDDLDGGPADETVRFAVGGTA